MSPLEEALTLYRSGRYQQALGLATQQLPPLLNLAAAAAYAQGLCEEAERHWRMALAVRPDYGDAHNNLGLLLADSGRLQEAEAMYRQALAAQPGHAEALNNLGVLLAKLERPGEAEAAYRQALAIRPDYAEAHNNLGNLLKGSTRGQEAEIHYRRALALRPAYAEAAYNLGNLLKDLERLEEAEASYRRVLALKPGHAQAHINLGIVLAGLKRHAEAEVAYRQALALNSDCAEALNNLGALLSDLNRHEEAEATYRRALALRPDSPETHNNLALLQAGTKRHAQAEAAYRQALALRPDDALTCFNLSLLLLSLGRYREGWLLHEARYHPEHRKRPVIPPALPFPRWQGEDLAGKSLLVWQEQGFGDEIQFCRFIPALKARGSGRIGLVCKPPLLALFQTLTGVDAVYPAQEGQVFEGYDYWTLPLSIPLHYGLSLDNLPATLPYLHALPERIARWQARLPATRPRIGLVWKGYGGHSNDAHRSLDSLATLAPLWRVPGLAFVSLQKGAGEPEASQPPPGQPLTHLGAELQDFADTAAILVQLDLLICVDTAAAHLAGALGKPCWVMLPYLHTDWRWLQEREDSPWYPSVLRLFRQGRSETWAELAERVAQALREL